MIKNISKNIDQNIFIIFICVTLMLLQLFNHGAILGHDSLTHMFRIVGVSDNLLSGNFFAKIHYNSINSFGYGAGIFYPQLNLVLPSIIYIFIKNVSISLNLYIYINTLLSGIIMYLYLKNKTKCNDSSLIGSLLYIMAPYSYIQSMFRGAIGEMTIFLSLPLIFWGIDKIIKNEKNGSIFLIIGTTYILQSHLISTIYTAIFTVIYLLINIKKIINKQVIKELIKSLIVVILLSLYFIVPLIEHYNAGEYNMLTFKNNPSSSVVHLSQLLYSNGENHGQKTGYDINGELPYTISSLIVGLLICLPACYKQIKENKEQKESVLFLILGFITVFMMCCPYIWGHISIIDIIQFPWRLLSYCVFFLAITCTYIFKSFDIPKKYFKVFLSIIIVLSFMQLNDYVINTPNYTTLNFDLKSITSNQIVDKENTYLFKSLGGANDYLPVECKIEYIASRGNNLIATSGSIENVDNYQLKNDELKANIKISRNTKIELPYIYYLGYKVTFNDKNINYTKNNNGFIEIDLREHSEGILKVKYTGTTIDIVSNYISVITFIAYLIYNVIAI